MNSAADAQAFARQFNDEEAVWRAFENLRLIRLLLGVRHPLPEECLDRADWLEAERQARPVRAIGIAVPQP